LRKLDIAVDRKVANAQTRAAPAITAVMTSPTVFASTSATMAKSATQKLKSFMECSGAEGSEVPYGHHGVPAGKDKSGAGAMVPARRRNRFAGAHALRSQAMKPQPDRV
jgi:hypothetical protein